MLRFSVIILVFFIIGCGAALPDFSPLEGRLLRLIEVRPKEGGEIYADGSVELIFSSPVNPVSLSRKTIVVVKKEDLGEETGDIELDEVSSLAVEGEYLIGGDNLNVTFTPEGGFKKDGEYMLIISRELASLDGLPFCGDSHCSGNFESSFFVDIGKSSEVSSVTGGSEAEGEETEDSGDDEVFSVGEAEESDETSELPRPSFLLINEIFYDAEGADTKGDVFIELAGEPSTYLDGYIIALINGDDGKIYKSITIDSDSVIGEEGLFVIADTDTGGLTNVTGADMLTNFDPQNGPDSIQLIDPDGGLVDVVGYGDIEAALSESGLPLYNGSPAEDVSSGISLSRDEEGTNTDDNSNDFSANSTPSPGTLKVTVEGGVN